MEQMTFIIPIRVDSKDRLDNCDTVIRYLTGNFPLAEIILVEQDAKPLSAGLAQKYPAIKWHFIEEGGYFRKSNVFNTGLKLATRKFVSFYDADCLLQVEAYRQTLNILRKGKYKLVLPFNYIFVFVSGSIKRAIVASGDPGTYGTIKRVSDFTETDELRMAIMLGGIFFADRDVVVSEGGFNRNMVSYGWEDTEFLARFHNLGYPAYTMRDYSLVHLDHERGPDSRINERYQDNKLEFYKVMGLSRSALFDYIDAELAPEMPCAPELRDRLRRELSSRNRLGLQMLSARLQRIRVLLGVYGLRGTAEIVRGKLQALVQKPTP